MEIKLKIWAISRDNSEYCHYAIPENRAEDREKPRKIILRKGLNETFLLS